MRVIMAILLFGLLVPGVMAVGQGDAARGYLGVGLADAPQGAPVAAAMVARLDPDGPGARAGLRQGDLIRSVNGHTVGDAHALQTYVFAQRPGAELAMDVLRYTPTGITSARVTATLSSGPGAGPSPGPAPSHGIGSPASRTAATPAPPVAAGAPADVQYRSYADPAENAFTVQVPAGWRVGGRMVRYGPISIAPFVQAMTPDGTIFVQLGDWHIKDYCDIPGWPEGHLYTPGTSVEFVRRVQSAEQYARGYAVSFGKQLGCENPSFSGSQSLPNPPAVATVPQARVETSMAQFNCHRGQEYTGRVMVTVQSYSLPTSVGWNIVYLASVLARQDRAATAFSVFDKMRNSFSFDSAWNTREALIARQATRPAMDALNATLKQSQDFDQHVINGNVTVHDPTTGAQSEIKMGVAPFYFADGLGHYYNSYNPSPRSGFHTVNPLP
jgi:hypothetical protein